MRLSTTFILRIAIALIGLPVLVLCVVVLPQMLSESLNSDTSAKSFELLVVAILYVMTVPFYLALYNGYTLLKLIDGGQAFSESSLRALRAIKYCAMVICGVFVAGTFVAFPYAQYDDAPGLVALPAFIAFVSFVVATFAALLHELFRSGFELKSENDLTV